MPAATASSLLHVTFIPPGHFSIFMVQRGTIIMFKPDGIVAVPPMTPVPMAGVPRLAMLIPDRSITLLVISVAPRDRVSSIPGPDSGPTRLA
jgi:hypothetical protein